MIVLIELIFETSRSIFYDLKKDYLFDKSLLINLVIKRCEFQKFKEPWFEFLK